MKSVMMVLMCMGGSVYGQNNQIKLYIQQIAASKVYIEYLQKGYSIVRTGLETIGDIKNGHFKLDKIFFDDLERINPKIRDYAKVADIVVLNAQIVKRAVKIIKEVRNSESFKKGELDHVESVVESVLLNTVALVDELESLLKKSAVKMSDDERMKRMEGLHHSMRSNYSFVNYFEGELQKISLQRKKELRDAEVLQELLKD